MTLSGIAMPLTDLIVCLESQLVAKVDASQSQVTTVVSFLQLIDITQIIGNIIAGKRNT